MSGFFPVDHGDMAHPVFGVERRPYTRWEAYCWLLDHAAIGPRDTEFQGKPVHLDRGQVALSIGALAKTWKWQKPAVRRFLNGLVESGFVDYFPVKNADPLSDPPIDPPSDPPVSLLTLCKYGRIQTRKQTADTPHSPVCDPPIDPVAPMTLYRDSYVNKEEGIKEKKGKGTSSASPSTRAPDGQGDLLPPGEVVAFTPPVEQLAYDAYNVAAERLDLRVCRSFSPARRASMRARLRELGGLDGWMVALDRAAESQFIRDWRTNGWRNFGLHSLLQQETLAKLMDGAYSGKRRTVQEPAQNHLWSAAQAHRELHPEDSFYHEISPVGVMKR